MYTVHTYEENSHVIARDKQEGKSDHAHKTRPQKLL